MCVLRRLIKPCRDEPQVCPARDEDVQVILVGFQGDGNERSGHASHSPPPSVVLGPWEDGETEAGGGNES